MRSHHLDRRIGGIKCIRSRCRKAYLPSCMVKKTMTGGSGGELAVTFPGGPIPSEIALLSENKDSILVRAEECLPISRLPLAGDFGLINDRLDESDDLGKRWSCHNCNIASPDFSPLIEPLIDQDTEFLQRGQKN